MNKIFVTKNEDIASVVEKVLELQDDTLVLVIPKSSRLLGSLANFHLLKREADSAGKKLLIESVDEQILALAKASGLEAVNPFLSGPRRPVSDIVSREFSAAEDAAPKPRFASRLPSPPESAPAPEEKAHRGKRRSRPSRRKLFVAALTGALVVLFTIASVSWLPRAEITVIRKKHAWDVAETVAAATRVAAVLPQALEIPAQLFEERRNVRLSFPASGRQTVERKARGTAIIYNAYSSQTQVLVANTRLLTPEGKLFRLVRAITVPGAKIEAGEIIPSPIEVEVLADRPGAEYNIGPVSRFSIPGFEGSPRHQGFYAESNHPMEGGYVGEVALPSDGDLESAREEIARTLRDQLLGFLRSQLPEGFTAPDDALQFRIVRETMLDDESDAGTFSVFAEAEMKMLAFREADMRTLAVALGRAELGEDMVAVELTLAYGAVSADFDEGRLRIPVTASGVFAEHIDPGAFREQAAGKTEGDLRTLVAALPGFESARISLWPFWVSRVPSKVDRINVRID